MRRAIFLLSFVATITHCFNINDVANDIIEKIEDLDKLQFL